MSSCNQLLDLQHTLYTSKNPTRRWLHCTRRDWIIEALSQSPAQERGCALEVGPGSGIYLPVLAELFTEVTASDIEESYLENAKKMISRHQNIKLELDDILHSNLPAAHFDLILCTEVIEHISDSQLAVSQIRRLLRPGGVLILSTPQRYSLLEITAKIAFLPGIIQLVRIIYREPILETGHINLLTEHQVTEQLRQAGFQIIERYKSGLYIPIIAEFLGQIGLQIEQWLENRIRGSLFDDILWTQYYIARA